MEPSFVAEATLVDLLDRVLDRGLVVYADIVVTLAGVPLIGIKLRAAVAGIETMAQYGMMMEWGQLYDDRAVATRGAVYGGAGPGD